jgi:EAL domain-containing protein (putative c-di-GMP-specific phosphodiesterase class I)
MTQDPDSLAIVKSVISLAHSLRLRVVAEGVETEEQAALLRDLKCDQAQGYLFGRPVPVENVADVLNRFTRSIQGV